MLLRGLVEQQPEWSLLEDHAKRNGGDAVPFDTHATSLLDVRIVLVQNFPTNADTAIVSDRLLHLGEDGLPKAKCWRFQFLAFVGVQVEQYGMNRENAIKHVMATTAVMNRVVCTGMPTWQQDKRVWYETAAGDSDPMVRKLVSRIMPHMPNVKCVAIFGASPYNVVHQGGGALQDSWFERHLLCHDEKLPHGQKLLLKWLTKHERDKLLAMDNEAVCKMRGETLRSLTEELMDDILGYKAETPKLSTPEVKERRRKYKRERNQQPEVSIGEHAKRHGGVARRSSFRRARY